MSDQILAALAGQPNSGKSTIFNMLTGARQFVANYPGVTVEKKVGYFSEGGRKIELVDLPGTYSITSYSMEERVTRDFILHDQPTLVVNVVDAANLRRNLYLTFQLLEMERPLLLDLNMIDVARKHGQEIDQDELARRLGVRVLVSDGKRGVGRVELRQAIAEAQGAVSNFRIDYGPLEPALERLQELLAAQPGLAGRCPVRWLALKLLEGDEKAQELAAKHAAQDWPELQKSLEAERQRFQQEHGLPTFRHIAFRRHETAEEIGRAVIHHKNQRGRSFTDMADRLLCHRVAGPLIMCGVFYLLFELAVNQGGQLAAMVTPWLSRGQGWLESFLPVAGFMEEPLISSLASWFMTSVSALLVYLPQFFILFSLIAILEDVGYMPRMAFMLDRIFRRFGLHGNSTLPFILGGIYVGGCAVPGVMACQAVPDERARLATILTVPLMNCLAKTAFYIMLVEAFFPEHKAGAMFFISTITLVMALPIARILTMTVLKGRETAPFIMELPTYHLPTLRSVLTRAFERIWTYIRKVLTIVAAVAVVIWALLQFPGAPAQIQAEFEAQGVAAKAAFAKAIAGTPLAAALPGEAELMSLFSFREAYRADKAAAAGDAVSSKAVDERYQAMNPVFFEAVKDRRAKTYKAFNKLRQQRDGLWRQMQQARINSSILGRMGKFLEPVSQWAGFDWRVNVAMLSSFAARESATATFKALYGIGNDGKYDGSAMLGSGTDKPITPLNATALMIFMALFPPCLATTIMVRVATRRYSWMLFSFAYPSLLGILAASLIYTGGGALGLSGWQAMWAYFGLACVFALIMGLLPETKRTKEVVQ
ncbi:ferrous iron transport protein B [Desulfarculus baarsii DSM 2075]|uniref:Ferrous iron transport protein B n=1 Tax=Desulfarculus baarsii (strain ATCC 33931 / DSM 2075 / LMG 7858 / VKM B-1802 / 2st14) TaxID=644282 RepID=E1QED0_DESB2|nr:ferrous iron transport protein B [Desulfarculus baarsii]ADK83916.1 ferrous iron transport protein B [Desulfarculus baarsii DSM 2075]